LIDAALLQVMAAVASYDIHSQNMSTDPVCRRQDLIPRTHINLLAGKFHNAGQNKLNGAVSVTLVKISTHFHFRGNEGEEGGGTFVILPDLMVSRVAASSWSQKVCSSALPSSLARKPRPLVQAKMEATGLVEVGLPFWYCLQCLVTVPASTTSL